MDALFFNTITGTVDRVYSAPSKKYDFTVTGLHISELEDDGFIHVLDVDGHASRPARWQFKNINEDILYKKHTSWVYVITIDNIVAKIGETGNMLGYRSNISQAHPSPSTKGRFSRYISGDGTDSDIRNNLDYFLKAGHIISFWAKKCETLVNNELILGEEILAESSTHKSQEIAYLDKFKKLVGSYPYLNKSRK